jgi:hypothetical protein
MFGLVIGWPKRHKTNLGSKGNDDGRQPKRILLFFVLIQKNQKIKAVFQKLHEH